MSISQGLVMDADEKPGFEILHLSFRKQESEAFSGAPINFYHGNIVFRLTDESAVGRMQYYLEENEKLRVAPDEDLLNSYYKDLHFVFDKSEELDEEKDGEKYTPLQILNKNGIKDEDVFIYAYRRNMMPLHDFIQYHEKFDVYQMREYFQDTPVVRGIIQYLQDMKDGKENPSRTVYHEQFLNTLENLCWWWD
jgi:hypothetical protein